MTPEQQKKSSTRRLRIARRKWLYEYLLDKQCIDCGEDDPVVLEFDHMRDKKPSIADAVNQRSLRFLKNEIAKCEIRCANCHRRKTAIEQRWTMARLHYSI